MSSRSCTILLVDDSEVLRRLAAVTLTSIGDYEVDQARDAAEALALMLDKEYDVVITDYYMPGLDGIEFVRRIRRNAENERVPVIMITTERDPFVEEEARAAGVDEFVTKPFDPLTIRELLERLVQAAKAPAMSLRIDAQSLLDAIPYPAMVLDRHRNVILGNQAFWRQTGAGIADVGVNCAHAMHASAAAPLDCPLVEAVRTGAAAEHDIIEGGVRYRVTVFPMDLYDDGGHCLYLHIARPVDEPIAG